LLFRKELALSKFLVFGSTGALGQVIVSLLESEGNDVLRAKRSKTSNTNANYSSLWDAGSIEPQSIDGLVWAQGVNSSNSVKSASLEDLLESLNANVFFIHQSIQELLRNNLLSKPCRAVVISSIWQQHARKEKYTYAVSKSALEGLVKSISIDGSTDELAINAVLPGVIDTPMTRRMLSEEQIKKVESLSSGRSLATPNEVAETVSWLLSSKSSGINGQSITVDRGWTVNRDV
jgi:3-oxoacyl-[acyl-carrier protein] reductase